MIFNSGADVAIFFGLLFLSFADLFAGIYFRFANPSSYVRSEWYARGMRQIPGMKYLKWWIFPIVWFILKILIISSLYIFYQQTILNAWFGTTNDVVTLVFISNMALNAIWVPVFFELRQPIVALLICLGLIATGIVILVFFTFDDFRFNTSFWLFLWYPIWCGFAFLLNLDWVIYDYEYPPTKKERKAGKV